MVCRLIDFPARNWFDLSTLERAFKSLSAFAMTLGPDLYSIIIYFKFKKKVEEKEEHEKNASLPYGDICVGGDLETSAAKGNKVVSHSMLLFLLLN